ncbi:NAD(P)H-dependent oxidoreductase [Parvularcula marina]|uniref:NAD(P)H-dependent oxidoreductase n=1 Tax=Parvularcula marina TaxID=2292771 RepID=UPI003514E6B3
MTKVAIIYHSGYGHTKLVAEAVAEGAAGVDGVSVDLVTAEDATDDLDRFDDADAIIFGSPTYMGSASGPMTTFMDATSKVWAEDRWKDKVAGGFTNSGSMAGDKFVTLQQFAVLAAQQGMIWVPLAMKNETNGPDMPAGDPKGLNRTGHYFGPGTQSDNAPAEKGNPPEGDIRTAQAYGERVAKAAIRWGTGPL